jgi:isoleucyl-tRNA synthetase
MAHENELKNAQKVSFKDTLNLPQTDFPIRANAAIDDPKIIERWAKEDLYQKAFEQNKGDTKYIFHDGPPYANGNIHLGTAYNKILKDIFTKSHRMMGMHVPVTPGWDCHGLPIELKVTTEFPGLKPEELKTKCREYASHWIDEQRKDFKRLGVVFNWDHPYMTMSKKYESDIIRAFGEFTKQGYIERSNKTVPWCASCQTVLANAEIEYADRKDPSIYVAFPLEPATQEKAFPGIDGQVNMLIWTTTPWTLPLNKMVILKPKAEYEVLEINDQLLVVGTALSDKICEKLDVPKKVVASCKAEDLIGGNALHPFIEGQLSHIVSGDFVGTDEGTACVHGAPGCGQDDYDIGIKNGIEIFSPLSDDGKYEEGILPQELVGMEVTKAHGPVIVMLQEKGRLIKKESIKHSYPHCWRCRKGLIFRATKQWFCNLAHNNLRQKALDAIEKINFVPDATRNRLKASVSGRLEWCLSRQRVWGAPIVAALCNGCNAAFTDEALFEKVAQGVSKEGIEYWDTVDLKTVLPADAKCKECNGTDFTKETDILDVWFESGISHYSVLRDNPELGFPADLYSEGSDQHRAWFQSSLLTSLVLEDAPCFKSVVTHGYTVDAKGTKMSKSLGNVIVPQEMIDKMGTDGLRLWAASIDFSSDAIVSDILVKNVQEVFRKMRNTCRFLVSNLYDFDIAKDAVPVNELLRIDQQALQKLSDFNQKVIEAYKGNDLSSVQHQFADYCAVQLSSFYLDIIKDRLYTDISDGKARRSAQTVCWYTLDALTRLMAPILSFTSEQLSDCYQKDKKESIHLQQFAQIPAVFEDSKKEKKERQFEELRSLRDCVLKALEKLRKEGTIKHSLEAKVTLAMNPQHEQTKPLVELFNDIEAAGHNKEQFLKEYFIVSACSIEDFEDEQELDQEYEAFAECCSADSGLLVKAGHADGSKCPRCWQWEITDHEHGLCNRCQMAVAKE